MIHTKTMNRLQQQLLEYDFDIRYKEGVSNTAADALSRNALIASLSDESGSVIEAQKSDPVCRRIIEYLKTGQLVRPEKNELEKIKKRAGSCFLAEGGLWHTIKQARQRDRVVLVAPASLQAKLKQAAHSSWAAGHGGVERTLSRLTSNFWWPGVAADVEQLVKTCRRCQEASRTKPKGALLQSLPICGEPNERVHMDLFGPLKTRSPSGNCYIMVITDAFTKYTELVAISNKRAETIDRTGLL